MAALHAGTGGLSYLSGDRGELSRKPEQGGPEGRAAGSQGRLWSKGVAWAIDVRCVGTLQGHSGAARRRAVAVDEAQPPHRVLFV